MNLYLRWIISYVNKCKTNLNQLQRQLGITFIFVTHDQKKRSPCLTVSSCCVRVKLAQDGSPREIYEDPANLFVARFIGEIKRI